MKMGSRLGYFHTSAWKCTSEKSTYRVLHSLPLWERRIAYFPAPAIAMLLVNFSAWLSGGE